MHIVLYLKFQVPLLRGIFSFLLFCLSYVGKFVLLYVFGFIYHIEIRIIFACQVMANLKSLNRVTQINQLLCTLFTYQKSWAPHSSDYFWPRLIVKQTKRGELNIFKFHIDLCVENVEFGLYSANYQSVFHMEYRRFNQFSCIFFILFFNGVPKPINLSLGKFSFTNLPFQVNELIFQLTFKLVKP